MQKLDDQGFLIRVQWNKANWALIPFDEKKAILYSFTAMKGSTTIVKLLVEQSPVSP